MSARKWLHERRNGSLPFVGFHPGASCETQRWPAEYFSELGTLLLREGQRGLILFGGPADRKLVESMARRIGETALTCITGDVRRFSALLACCQLLVCNNSGPLHVACALGIPTVSFMGPSVKERWSPRGNRHRVLRRDRLPCIGCNRGRCAMKTHDCMRQIGPEEVLEVIRGDSHVSYLSARSRVTMSAESCPICRETIGQGAPPRGGIFPTCAADAAGSSTCTRSLNTAACGTSMPAVRNARSMQGLTLRGKRSFTGAGLPANWTGSRN